MTTREEWLALAERCAKAEGPSFALEQAIGLAAGVSVSLALPYTASLDAITGLVEAARPVMSYEVRRSGAGDKGQATIWNPARSPSAGYDIRVTGRPSPALALCEAFCRAMAEKAGAPGRD